ncbi:hypothetical protein V8B97DRAFT_1915789 [Scleroderma yunnanense]
MGVSFWDDLWIDILEHIAMLPTGWQDVKVAWQNVKSLDSAQAPTLLDDLRAWCLIQAWAYGQANFSQVGDTMDTVFGEWFVQEEWEDIFDPMYQVWVEEEEVANPWTCEIFEEILVHQGLSLPLL